MITIENDNNCCGCEACRQICPHNAISMLPNNEGFLYPKVKPELCVNCRLCENVCPEQTRSKINVPLICYAAKNQKEEVRMNSSSGGVFYPIAQQIIENGGAVFGAKYNDQWQVEHAKVEDLIELKSLQGSKYVQSRIKDTYKEAKSLLECGQLVLFSGTPCQITGLKSFLRKDYDNLFTIEVVCHGVPSPQVWLDYVSHLKNDITNINMRDKRNGWRNYGMFLEGVNRKFDVFESKDKSLYIRGMLCNLFLRPSCYSCKFKLAHSMSDIVIGDFWGIERHIPSLDDNLGVSIVICNTEKGEKLFGDINLVCEEAILNDAIKGNPCIVQSVKLPLERDEFWASYRKNRIKAIEIYVKKMTPSPYSVFLNRIINKIKQITK